MRGLENAPEHWRNQFPEELRARMYRVVFDEMAKVAPRTPIAFCREQRSTWDLFKDELARTGQDPDDYVCNCGPFSDPTHPALAGRARG